MTDVEMELIRWRDSFVGHYQAPGMFEKAREHAKINISQGQEPNAMQICYAYIVILDETMCNFYAQNQGKTLSSYYGFNQDEQNAIIEVCKKANGLGIAVGGGAAGAYLGASLFGLVGAAVGGVLGAVAGSKYNDNDKNKIFGVVREAIHLYFNILISHNNKNKYLQDRFISLANEFMKKNNLTENDFFRFGDEALKLGVNISQFTTVAEFENQYYKMYPKKLDNKSSDIKSNNVSSNNVPALKRLESLIGLESVKTQVKRLRSVLLKDKGNLKNINLNMCFYGNPGTGKTVVARLIADILYEEGILKTNNLIETDRSGLVGEYVGQTAPKTHAVFEKAIDGVLFVDEAYTLNSRGTNDFGHEAVAALLADMENYRGKICVILAGYKYEMEEMISMNPGFDSRINRKIDFPDYTNAELIEIMKMDLKKYGRKISREALEECGRILEFYSKMPKFANGRTVRNLVESLRDIQSERTVDETGNYTIAMADVEIYKKEHNIYINS